jgi:hypothetical protein
MTDEYIQKINFIKNDKRFELFDVFDNYTISLFKIGDLLQRIKILEKYDDCRILINNFYLFLYMLDKAKGDKCWFNIYKDKVFLKSHIRKLKYEKILVE